jgi:outer membrane protein assembly factor BamE (lipoprotein component of BamABCDE complex)
MHDRLKALAAAILAVVALSLSGCGLAYQAGSQIKTSRMKDDLKVGETAAQVHEDWGEPDLRKDLGANSEIWSYARRPNSNDLAATIFYTSTKSGDEGKFLDLKFSDGKLVSWAESERTMPAKQGAGFSYGLGPGGAVSPVQRY